MNQYPLFETYPSVKDDILCVILDNGAPYHFSAHGVKLVEPGYSCCGGEVRGAIVTTSGRVYMTLHSYADILRLWKDWQGGGGDKAA